MSLKYEKIVSSSRKILPKKILSNEIFINLSTITEKTFPRCLFLNKFIVEKNVERTGKSKKLSAFCLTHLILSFIFFNFSQWQPTSPWMYFSAKQMNSKLLQFYFFFLLAIVVWYIYEKIIQLSFSYFISFLFLLRFLSSLESHFFGSFLCNSSALNSVFKGEIASHFSLCGVPVKSELVIDWRLLGIWLRLRGL